MPCFLLDVVRSSVKVLQFDIHTREEGRRTYRPKCCGNNNKDEDNSPKTLNDRELACFEIMLLKNYLLIYIYIYIYIKMVVVGPKKE